MPKWLKILLILFGLGILVLGLAIGAFVWWFNANKEDIAKNGRAALEEGTAFGSTHAKDDCVEDGLRRLETCGAMGFMCEAENNMRLKACMDAASDDHTCDSAPSPNEIMKLALWSNQECANRRHQGSQPCGRLMQALAQSCAKK